MALLAAFVPGNASAAAGLPPGLSGAGKPMLVPGFAARYAQRPSAAGGAVLTAAPEVYDTSLDVVFSYSGAQPTVVNVSAVQFTWGTQTEYVNETRGNSTTLVPVSVRVEENPTAVGLSVPLYPRTQSYVPLALPVATSLENLEVSVDGATWNLTHLTPAGSSFASFEASLGLNGVLIIEALLTGAILLGVWRTARWMGKRVYHVPKVRLWWPALCVTPWVAFFFADYVDFNQLFGAVSPVLIPAVIGLGAFPYLVRGWHNYRQAQFVGFDMRTTTTGQAPSFALPTVKTKDGLRRAPETWREAFWTLVGVPLPEVAMDTVASAGVKVKIEPSGLPVTCPTVPAQEVDADEIFWYDARAGVTATRHRLVWTREVTVAKDVPLPDGTVRTDKRTVRRFSPHVEPGILRGRFPPIRDMLEYLTGIRTVEEEAQAHEVDKLLVAHLRGSILRERRDASKELLEVAIRAAYERATPASREELERRVLAHRRARQHEEGHGGGSVPT